MNATRLGTAPDFAEPLEAWRVWRVVDRGGELSLGSVIKPTLWPAGEPLVAQCLHHRPFFARVRRRPGHGAPEPKCECGIYGATLEWITRYLTDLLPRYAVGHVLGRVALWGNVVECERGFRASHAYPLELYVPADASCDPRLDSREIADGLARYRVPVELLATRSRHAVARLRLPRLTELP